jgi:uncharacterized protein YjiS (DUF1127 family)
MTGIALTSGPYYSGSPFPASRDWLVTCADHLLSTVIGKEIPMSSKQHRNLHAKPADADALESLQHMTSWARQSVTSPEAAAAKKPFATFIEGFALGATAFHPGPWQLPIDRRDEDGLDLEARPEEPGFASRAFRSVGEAMMRALHSYRRRREIARASADLSAMDDRSLQDIGICRADIGRAARHGRDWERWR